MNAPDTIASRLIGALFVERGLVSESQIRVALEIQRETGEQLGQILVQRFGVSRKELARVVAEQWRDMGQGTAELERSPAESWRPLGEIFVTRGFITEEELDGALKRQRKTGERLGEALVGLGVISKFELAGALAEQMASLGEDDTDESGGQHATVHQLPDRTAVVDEYGLLAETTEEVEPEEAAEAAEPAEASLDWVDELVTDADVIEAPVDDQESYDEVAAVEEEAVSEHDAEPAAPVEPEAATPFELEPPVELWDPVAHTEPVVEPAVEPSFELAEVPAEPSLDVVLEPEAATPFELEPPAELWEASAFAGPAVEASPEPVAEVVEAPAEPALETVVEEEAPPALEPDAAEDDVAENGHRLEPGEPFAVGSWHLLVSAQAPELGVSVAFSPTRDGYKLVPLEDLPSVGTTIDVPDVGAQVVLRLGRSPLPGDLRVCVYLEDPVTPASDEAA